MEPSLLLLLPLGFLFGLLPLAVGENICQISICFVH